jgi:hypothetical protein
MESRYLYHPENRDVYYQSLNQETKCLHSRNLNALLDSDKEDIRFNFLKEHVSQCQKCKKQYEILSLKRKNTDSLIPNSAPSKEGLNEMESELDSFITKIEDSIIRSKKSSKKKQLDFIKLATSDLIVSAFSPATMVGLAIAMVGVFALKLVL